MTTGSCNNVAWPHLINIVTICSFLREINLSAIMSYLKTYKCTAGLYKKKIIVTTVNKFFPKFVAVRTRISITIIKLKLKVAGR
jgi:hypothetical protein